MSINKFSNRGWIDPEIEDELRHIDDRNIGYNMEGNNKRVNNTHRSALSI